MIGFFRSDKLKGLRASYNKARTAEAEHFSTHCTVQGFRWQKNLVASNFCFEVFEGFIGT